jgi:beta-lactamase superfamily II metal-dependent hydrolase
LFQIELLPAAHGDCIWITYGDPGSPSHILIDGGPTPTWEGALKAQVEKQPDIELFVLTHIDADHIAGAIPFLKEAKDVTFGDVWFNGWKHLPSTKFLSSKQGEIFSTLLTDRGDPWNRQFGEGPVQVTEDDLPQVTLDGGMKITLLSPTRRQLYRLRKKWSTEIMRSGLTPGAHHQFRQFLARQPNPSTDVPALAATPFKSDGSVPNAASIAFLAEYEGKTAMFTGDAVPSVLTQSVKVLLAQTGEDRLRLDALKVPHHGSRGNVNTKLLDLLDCSQYLISSNGDIHNLPDNEAIGRIIHHTDGEAQLVFNYHAERSEAWESKDLQERYEFTATYGDDGRARIELSD